MRPDGAQRLAKSIRPETEFLTSYDSPSRCALRDQPVVRQRRRCADAVTFKLVHPIRERLRALNRQGLSQEEITQTLLKEFNYGTRPAAGQIAPMVRELK